MADEEKATLGELNAVVAAIQGWGEERPYIEINGWSAPALNKQDLATIFQTFAEQLEAKAATGLSQDLIDRLPNIHNRLRAFRKVNLSQFPGNAPAVSGPAALFVEWLRLQLEPTQPDWERIHPDELPTKIRRRLRAANASLDSLEPDVNVLGAKISEINQAHEAALSLPTDLQSLQEANGHLKKITSESEASKAAIEAAKEEAEEHLKALASARTEAKQTLELVQQAYAAATSRGLAAAFEERSNKLTRSVAYCVVGLIAALGIGAYIGSARVAALSMAIASGQEWGRLLTELVFAVLSIGAPLWFAWLMTKQIGQRFRMGEDYAFKASVAKAYEGFRREAVRIDPVFEARLFGSILTRLDEAPLRLVEASSHGSPYQELFNSEHFRRALDLVPELKDQFISAAKAGFGKVAPGRPPSANEVAAPKPEA